MPAAVASAVVLAALFAAACGGGHEPSAQSESLEPAQVRVAPVVVKPRAAVEEVAGTVEAKSRATIEAKISGRIVELPVVAGQTVHRGQMLARLDVGEIQARLEQARARLEQAKRDRARFANLLERQAVTQRQYDEVEARFRVAQAAVAEAETMFGYATITAPFDGVVVRKAADVGDLASPGKPLLVLEDPSALQVKGHVSEALISRVRIGDR
ncbi:MAG: efflux RND transporter periplasmic adaptor subunit, partial [Deltaproteobacteria bacterium]